MITSTIRSILQEMDRELRGASRGGDGTLEAFHRSAIAARRAGRLIEVPYWLAHEIKSKWDAGVMRATNEFTWDPAVETLEDMINALLWYYRRVSSLRERARVSFLQVFSSVQKIYLDKTISSDSVEITAKLLTRLRADLDETHKIRNTGGPIGTSEGESIYFHMLQDLRREVPRFLAYVIDVFGPAFPELKKYAPRR